MKNILRFIYKKYSNQFNEFMIEDFIAQTPEKVQDDALDFLAQGRVRLESWIFFNSYYLQRRAVGDLPNAQIYQGMMIYLKILLGLINRKQVTQSTSPLTIPKEEESDDLSKVDSFITGFQEFKNKESKKDIKE